MMLILCKCNLIILSTKMAVKLTFCEVVGGTGSLSPGLESGLLCCFVPEATFQSFSLFSCRTRCL